jgi:hypothetical protein
MCWHATLSVDGSKLNIHLPCDYKSNSIFTSCNYSVGDISEEELHEKAVLPVSDDHGKLIPVPSTEGGDVSKTTDKKGSFGSHSVIGSGIESLKYLYSVALLIFSLIIVMTAIFSHQTAAANKHVPPIAAFFIFWFLIIWLAMMEGGQGALVGLQPIEKNLYADSHPKSLMNTSLAHKGDNMERFIVGRQFLVVLVVFVTNMMASAIPNASVLNLSGGVSSLFVDSGVALILVTIMLGQLTAQVNAANCMLDFINNYFMLFTTYVSLGIEMSGKCTHASATARSFAKYN